MDSAVVSSIFYGCEIWLCENPEHAIKTYNQLVRCLLSVRSNTSTNMCLVESGKPPAKYVINKRIKTFLEKKMERQDMDEPFQIAYEMCRDKNSPGYRFLKKAMEKNLEDESLEMITRSIRAKEGATKLITYRTELNPDLNTHKIYGRTVYIPDYIRVSFTRLRVMSHNLRIETGRWSKLDRERRVCRCNNTSVQDEKHVLLHCSLSNTVRTKYPMLPFSSINNLMRCDDIANTCRFINEVLKIYE